MKEVLNAFEEVEESFDKSFQRSFELGRGIAGQVSSILKVTVDRIAASVYSTSVAVGVGWSCTRPNIMECTPPASH
jgi:hypothetical protein